MYLLLGLIASTRPLGNDIFLGFSVGRKGEGDAGKGSALGRGQQLRHTCRRQDGTHKIDADNQLRLGAAFARDLCHARRSVLLRRRPHGSAWVRWRRTVASILARRRLRGIARRPALRRVAHGLLLLRRVSSRRTRVDGRQRARGTAVLGVVGGSEAARLRERVRGRAAQRVLLVHGERRAARVRGLRRQRRRPLLACGGDGALR
jgi:hypothetical protein